MKRVEQVALKPGRYRIGKDEKGQPVFRDLTAADLKKYIDGTKTLLEAGYAPPLLLEHPAKGTSEGAPKSPREAKADEMRNSAGWLSHAMAGNDGAMAHVLDITDSEIARKVQEGSIKFTSPELRPSWTDGKGRVFENIISHVAFTHKPRNPDQSEFRELAESQQFSLEDWEPIQMADEDEKDTKEAPAGDPPASEAPPEKKEEPPANPDLPQESETAGIADMAQRIEAICAHLEKLGISLPEDTKAQEIETILDRILTGLKTAAAITEKSDAEDAADEAKEGDSQRPPVVEQQGVMQYSLSDDTIIPSKGQKSPSKLLARVIRGEHQGLVDKLAGMVGKNKITSAARDQLLGIDGVMQFSDQGDFVPSLTIAKVADILDECLPEGMALTAAQIADQFSLEEHHEGDQHYQGNDLLTAAQAKKANDELAAKGVLPPTR